MSYNIFGEYIESSEVPEVKVSDPVVQRMIDEVSKVLRGVNDRYFPLIQYVNAIRQGEQYVLFFVAEGKGFKIGIVCGTDGVIQQVLFISEGKYQEPFNIKSRDHLRQMVDFVGSVLVRRK